MGSPTAVFLWELVLRSQEVDMVGKNVRNTAQQVRRDYERCSLRASQICAGCPGGGVAHCGFFWALVLGLQGVDLVEKNVRNTVQQVRCDYERCSLRASQICAGCPGGGVAHCGFFWALVLRSQEVDMVEKNVRNTVQQVRRDYEHSLLHGS